MYKQKEKVLLDYKLKSSVNSFDRLKPLVNALSKKRRDTLLKLADKKGTNVI
jgi:hypothetical protein